MATFKKHRPGLRRSQAVTTFGPGAIVDLRNVSAMMAGTNFWPEPKADDDVEIHEPNLEKLLGVDGFRLPATKSGSSDKNIPAVIFPRWLVCPKCHRLAPYEYFTMGMQSLDKEIRCPNCRIKVYPARLVVACKHGHIDDFPWVEWTHRDTGEAVCKRPSLFLRARGFSSSLADILIECKTCGALSHLGGATRPENIAFMKCPGTRPWLGDKTGCGMELQPLQRGASNVYFSVLASSISIPPWSDAIYRVLDPHWRTLKRVRDQVILESLIDTLDLSSQLDASAGEIANAVLYRQSMESGEDSEQVTEKELRLQECLALRRGSPDADPLSEFKAIPTTVPPDLTQFLSKVVLIHRLREVRALTGFARVDPPDPNSRLSSLLAPISRTRLRWNPAVEVRGEGIYLELNEDAIKPWAKDSDTRERAVLLHRAYEAMCGRRGWQVDRTITPRFVLVHSLAHALIGQLALESGYSSAALRERLYVFEPDDEMASDAIAGLLIYTSTPDSEGSLGGLVRQGEPDRLDRLLLNAINDIAWCSSDPLCIESQGQGPDSTNLAACHACLLLSETCCEEYNRFLDRGMLTGTLDRSQTGFFNSLVR